MLSNGYEFFRGLCGMRPKQGDIVRPFLEQTREELVTYARVHNIPHVEDHTNADPNAAARNYLRLEILPRLKELNPRAPQHIATTARSLTALDDALEQAAERMRQHSFTTLRLGAYTSVARQWLPAILAAYRDICPDTDVAISMGDSVGTYEAVRNDKLDCAVVSYQPHLCQGLSWTHLRDDELVAILPADCGGDNGSYRVENFTGQHFLMPSSGFDLDILPALSAHGRKAAPIIRNTYMDDPSIVSMVEHKLGVSILSKLVMQSIDGNVNILPLDPPAYRKLGIITTPHHLNGKNVRRFIRCAQDTLAKLYNER